MAGVLVLFLRVTIVIILYSFLGLFLVVQWKELRTQIAFINQRKVKPIELKINDQNAQQSVRVTDQEEITIGRNKANKIHLPDSTVSGQHARLTFHHGHWWIEDRKSKNGTYLNNQIILSPTIIVEDDEIVIGKIRIIVAFPK